MASPIFKRYLLALSRYKWVIPTGIALGIGASGLVAAQPDPPPTYTVTATFVSNRPPTIFSATSAEVRQPLEATSGEALLSDEVIKATAKEVGLDPKTLARSLKLVLPGAIAGAPAKKADKEAPTQIKLEYHDTDQGRAKQVIEQITKRIVDQSQATNSARLRSIITSLNLRLPQVRSALNAAEQSLEAYDQSEGPALASAQNGSLVGSIQQSENQQRQIRLELEGITTETASLQQKLGLNANQAYVSSALSADPLVADLRVKIHQIDSQIAISGQDLRSEHPTMIALNQQKTAYEAQLRQRAGEVLGGNGVAAPFAAASNIRTGSSLDPERQRMANRLVELTTQADRLTHQLGTVDRFGQESRQQLSTLPNKQLARTRLEDQLKLKKILYDQMQAKLVDATTAEAETVSSISIAQIAPTPIEPSPPKIVPLIMGIGGLVGLVLGAGVIFLLDTLEGTFYTAEDLRDACRQQEVPMLGLLPQVQSWVDAPRSPILAQPDAPYLEYYERFRSALRLSEGLARLPRVVMLTSTIAREGKSVCAYNLAIASARAGQRTLLIEADLRSASLASQVGIQLDADMQVEPLRYYGQLSDCVRLAASVENLYVVPSVGPQRHAAAILESSEMRRLLEDARGRFDLVVLDTPSLSQCNDALLLEARTDGMVIVTRPGVTQQSLLTEAINELMESDQRRLLGVVVNGADLPIPAGWGTAAPVATAQPVG
jgi:capsular exopolysaccharide synthesis family protein